MRRIRRAVASFLAELRAPDELLCCAVYDCGRPWDDPVHQRMRPLRSKNPGFWVESLDDHGGVMTNVPPSFTRHLQGAYGWFESEISGAESAPSDWCAADIQEVRLTWVRGPRGKSAFEEALGADVVIPNVGPKGRALSLPEALSLRSWWDRNRRQGAR